MPGKNPMPAERWINIGPAPIRDGQTSPRQPVSGRVADIAVDPMDTNHWLIGAAQGGIWETRNAGVNWRPLTDDQPSLALGAITYAPGDPNVVYAGTGEAVFSGDSYAGSGLLKSEDGGQSFVALDSPYSGSFFALQVRDDGTLLAAGLKGNAFISIDGGNSFVPAPVPMPVSFSDAIRSADGQLLLVNQVV